MAIKSKSDIWLSVIALVLAAASLIYCSGFIADFFDSRGVDAAETIARLRNVLKGSVL
ncbi:hypothetical protein SAMN04488127_0953 [Bhargavaea ginsengi]|uniref:Uncharacterized protein n=1 Tax=Bhargavaea ginsengi TaxID=426757 RepID=A0A1H6VC01_9BACL|nr:hypothetical protein [Bhargavaea ginsengi]MCM3088339.1 hypothetical protein [Bhargavaea ginsengi]SEI97725.1 hypothetical protein SAMN04488127_0953 [Bhargavaea ginsengi]